MSTPTRVQRSRARGSKLPPNTVCVTRPSRWGNPYKIGDRALLNGRIRILKTAEQVVERFRCYAIRRATDPTYLAPLRGKNLACWCPLGSPCHADVLLELANREPETC